MIVSPCPAAGEAKTNRTQQFILVVMKDLRETHHEVLLDRGSVGRMPGAVWLSIGEDWYLDCARRRIHFAQWRRRKDFAGRENSRCKEGV